MVLSTLYLWIYVCFSEISFTLLYLSPLSAVFLPLFTALFHPLSVVTLVLPYLFSFPALPFVLLFFSCLKSLNPLPSFASFRIPPWFIFFILQPILPLSSLSSSSFLLIPFSLHAFLSSFAFPFYNHVFHLFCLPFYLPLCIPSFFFHITIFFLPSFLPVFMESFFYSSFLPSVLSFLHETLLMSDPDRLLCFL